METGEEEEEGPLPPANLRVPRNHGPVASATQSDTPESPVRSGDPGTSLGLHSVKIGFGFL